MHRLVDGNGRPLVTLVGPGQAGDAPMFPHLMRHLRIRRAGRGRARSGSHPADWVRGDKAYSSRAIRRHLRARSITAVIPEPADQVGHRKRRGSRGGRPPGFDPVDYRGRSGLPCGKRLRGVPGHLAEYPTE
ncbi:transposase [Amycolatopsis sp. FDAARGOS 1241]|uniref:transposase n=1 Tax=Amycolatopsis sp. FDAARGOS 1241 TaxID=2778070 RepID=UPI00194F14CF|nr:transposase [Amycolatopsis sp. FDAARGOS 1241]